MADERERMVSMNEVMEAFSRLTPDRIRVLLGGRAPLSGCDYDCTCNHSMCGCRGSVSKHDLDMISLPELDRLRQQRIAELKSQLADLERER